MNETKLIVYVPFHEQEGFNWPSLTDNYNETKCLLIKDWKWYQIVVDGNTKQEIK